MVTGVTGNSPNFNNFYVSAMTANLKKSVSGYAAIFNQVPANWKAAGVASFHSLDLPYVFGVYDDPSEWIWRLSARAGGIAPRLTAPDKIVSQSVMKLWAEFARTGKPGKVGQANLGSWPAWTPAKDQYLYLEEDLQIESGLLPASVRPLNIKPAAR